MIVVFLNSVLIYMQYLGFQSPVFRLCQSWLDNSLGRSFEFEFEIEQLLATLCHQLVTLNAKDTMWQIFVCLVCTWLDKWLYPTSKTFCHLVPSAQYTLWQKALYGNTFTVYCLHHCLSMFLPLIVLLWH